MTLKIKDTNIVFQTILYNETNKITKVFLWILDPDPEPFFSRIRPDLDPQHCK